MANWQRGFTLIETLVVVGIVAILLAAGGLFLLGMRPGALVQATDDFDAVMASARSVAATSGNGATLVFAPRASPAAPGFELRVYLGRPTRTGGVASTNAMPVVSDAAVSEATFGSPPFAIFIGSSGHVSGKASYPTIDNAGKATFPKIAAEPACPNGGFVLTFVGPQGARQTRTIPCGMSLVAASAAPNPSPTPNAPLVTPATLVYHWPADAEQSFVVTEWGYTHWFATTNGFTCGNGIATFPNILPDPYTRAYTAAEAAANPQPPAQTPFSFPNSNGQSMNDAPATFPLDPTTAGVCDAGIADDYDQQATTKVQVMGWLTAAYGGNSATHLTKALELPASAFTHKGASVTIDVSKTYDTEALALEVAFDALCRTYLSASASVGTTPNRLSSAPATATVNLTAIAVPPYTITCSATIYDQYPNSITGEDVIINITLGSSQLMTWPSYVMYPTKGGTLEVHGVCAQDQPQAYTDATFSTPLLGATPPAASNFLSDYSTDASTGCLLYEGAAVRQFDSTGVANTSASGVSVLIADANVTSTKNLYSIGNPANGANCDAKFFVTTLFGNGGPNAGVLGQGFSPAGTYSCSIGITDQLTPTATTQSTTTIQVASAQCTSGTPCGLTIERLTGTSTGSGPYALCGSGLYWDEDQLDYYESTDGGSTWLLEWDSGSYDRHVFVDGACTNESLTLPSPIPASFVKPQWSMVITYYGNTTGSLSVEVAAPPYSVDWANLSPGPNNGTKPALNP